jgi:hypothetical protein
MGQGVGGLNLIKLKCRCGVFFNLKVCNGFCFREGGPKGQIFIEEEMPGKWYLSKGLFMNRRVRCLPDISPQKCSGGGTFL